MIPVRDLTTADEVIANIKRLRGVFYPSRPMALAQVNMASEKADDEGIVAIETTVEPLGSCGNSAESGATTEVVATPPSTDDLVAGFRLVFSTAVTPRVSMQAILERICYRFHVSMNDIRSSRKSQDVTHPRFAFYWVAREMTGQSLPAIGRFLGGRDHTTVLNGIRRCEQLMVRNPEFKIAVVQVRNWIEERI